MGYVSEEGRVLNLSFDEWFDHHYETVVKAFSKQISDREIKERKQRQIETTTTTTVIEKIELETNGKIENENSPVSNYSIE